MTVLIPYASLEPTPWKNGGGVTTDIAFDDDIDTLHGDAATRRGVPLHNKKTAAACGAGALTRVAFDVNAARHHVLAHALSGAALNHDCWHACSCRRRSSRRCLEY